MTGSTGLPSTWISAGVHAGYDQYVLTRYPVEKAVGKPSEEGAPRLAMDGRMPGRTLLDGSERFPDSLEELLSQASLLLLVPQKCILDIRSGGGT